MKYDLKIHTFGCKVNTYDTGLLQARFAKSQSLDQEANGTRVHVLNTCAVTAEATKEAVKLVRRIKAREPLATVVVTGCGAQVDGEIFDVLPGADLIVANSHKGQLEVLLDQYFKGTLNGRVFRSNIFRKDDLEAGGGIEAGHTRAFLKIQDGCNSFCTYCVIPFARGKSRSISVKELVRAVAELRLRGAAEVVLTGVHIGDYEDQENARVFHLTDLIKEILAKTDMPRLRLSSLEPVELTPELLKLYLENDRLCPHFHMSIQSANTRILELMRRKYDATAVETALMAISENLPQAFVGMDVIAGFPGETEDEFADTYARLERLPWTRMHVFPYSERPGTKAASLSETIAPAVPREIRVLRAQRLRQLSSERFARIAKEQVGQKKIAMILKGGGEALSRDYWPLRLVEKNGAALDTVDLRNLQERVGEELLVEVTGFDTSNLSRMDGVLMATPIGFAQ